MKNKEKKRKEKKARKGMMVQKKTWKMGDKMKGKKEFSSNKKKGEETVNERKMKESYFEKESR